MEPVEGVEAGRDMKQSLKAIQCTSEQTITAQGQLKEVDSALVDINKAMALPRMQLQLSGQPFLHNTPNDRESWCRIFQCLCQSDVALLWC